MQEPECSNHHSSFSHQESLSPIFSNYTEGVVPPSLEHGMYQPCPQLPHQEAIDGQRESHSLDLKQMLQISSTNSPSPATVSSSNVPMPVSMPVSMSIPLHQTPGPRDTNRVAASRSAHNIVEKRYRTNLNARFAALERVLQGSTRSTEDRYSSSKRPVKGRGAVGPRKSELLEDAVIYIQELRGEKKKLLKEVSVLKGNFLATNIQRGSQTQRSGRSNFSDRNGTEKEN
jgi:Helix-loop-helix DNA-binding domain